MTNTDKLDTVEIKEPGKTLLKTAEIVEPVELDCKVSDEPFEAQIEVFYKPQNEVIELVSFREWLQEEFESETIESITVKVKKGLEEVLDGVKVHVKGTANSDIHPNSTVKTYEGDTDDL